MIIKSFDNLQVKQLKTLCNKTMQFYQVSVILSVIVASVSAYGGSKGGNQMYEARQQQSFNRGGYGGGYQQMEMFSGHSESGSRGGGVIQAAVKTRHTFETRPVPIEEEDSEPTIVEVEGGNLPLELHFKSSSSRIKVRQSHQSGEAGQTEHSSAEEEPHRLIHEVRKPIIQEVREIITPYRKVVQMIEPVVEEIHTIVAKGERRQRNQQAGQSTGKFNPQRPAYGGRPVALPSNQY